MTADDGLTPDCADACCRPVPKPAGDRLRQREGDQPLPTPNGRPGAHDQLIAQLTARRELGLERYGALLQPHNGRDTGRDLIEELLDAAVYAQTLATELADLRLLARAAELTLRELERDGRAAPFLEAALERVDGRAG